MSMKLIKKRIKAIEIEIPLPQTLKYPYPQNDIYKVLFHEIVHSIDPKKTKFNRSSPENLGEGDAYSQFPEEVDAFQTAFVHCMMNAVEQNEITTEEVNNWLRNQNYKLNTEKFLDFNTREIFDRWTRKYPKIIKLIKQRTYAALQKNVRLIGNNR